MCTRYCWNGTENSGGIGPNGKPEESAGGKLHVGFASVVAAVFVAVGLGSV